MKFIPCKPILIAAALCVSIFISVSLHAESTQQWSQAQAQVALDRILDNISRPGTAVGSVVASPQQAGPNYYYNWVRDAALTVNELESLYDHMNDTQQKETLLNLFRDYASFSRSNQTTPTLAGLG